MRITTKQIDAIVPFLEPFERKDFEFATWNPPRNEDGTAVISLDNMWRLSEQAQEFTAALYENGWIADFDWPSWQDEAVKYVGSAEKMASADLETIRRLLTTHVRKDRFCDGHLAAMFENGHITALLRRLKELRPTVLEEETKRRKASMERWRERSRHRPQEAVEKNSQHDEPAKARAEVPMAAQENRGITDNDTADGQKRLFPE